MSKIVGVMLTLPFDNVFDYKAPDEVKIGDIVRVPFGKKHEIGIVFKIGATALLEEKKIKPVTEILPYTLKPEFIKFIEFNYIASKARWIATSQLVSGHSPLKPLIFYETNLRTIIIVPHGEDG